jgi:transcriptional regulator with XRE-family HTH domain
VDSKELLGRNVVRLRKACGLSQEELAAKSGLHRTYISGIERGRRNISVDNLFALAEALGVEPSELVSKTSR